jgi:hypothetical protein
MDVQKRIEIERRVVRKLVRVAKAAGWEVPAVNDGEELVRCQTEADVLDAVFSVDESSIRFRKEIDGKAVTCSAYIVLGNDGWDAICDHSTHPAFEADVTEPVLAWIDAMEAATC